MLKRKVIIVRDLKGYDKKFEVKELNALWLVDYVEEKKNNNRVLKSN